MYFIFIRPPLSTPAGLSQMDEAGPQLPKHPENLYLNDSVLWWLNLGLTTGLVCPE